MEKQLIQARLRSINSLLDNNTKQLELTRSQIASILPNSSYRKCQEFIEKGKELRFKKVKDRQVRKFITLLNKKEGNITWQSSQVTQAAGASPLVANSHVTLAATSSQAVNRQVTLVTRAITSSQAGRQLTPLGRLPRWLYRQAGR